MPLYPAHLVNVGGAPMADQWKIAYLPNIGLLGRDQDDSPDRTVMLTSIGLDYANHPRLPHLLRGAVVETEACAALRTRRMGRIPHRPAPDPHPLPAVPGLGSLRTDGMSTPMIELELTEGPGVDVPLDLRTVRGRSAPDVPAQLVGRVVVGSPRARLLTPADADTDQDLRRFIEAEASTSSYDLVALSCTFVSDDQQRLADAWLRIDLNGAVAHSMEPVSLEEITELSYNNQDWRSLHHQQ
jgi:hypothetical protein